MQTDMQAVEIACNNGHEKVLRLLVEEFEISPTAPDSVCELIM